MAIDYTQIAADTLTQIAEFGTDVNVTQTTEGAFDPATGNTLPGSDVVATGKGVLTQFKTMEVDGTVVQRGDMRLLLASSGLSVVPAANDTITICSVVWTVINVESVEPAGVSVLYKVQIRK